MVKYRNARTKNIDSYIDVELEHHELGWIEFTASKYDNTVNIYQDLITNPDIDISIAPNDFCEWHENQWVLNISILDAVKLEKTEEINVERDKSLVAGFEYNGNIFDSDYKSIQRITGLVTQTLLNPDFSTSYITKDNQTMLLNTNQLHDLGKAASKHESDIVFKARKLKDAVLAATNIEEVEAIKW